MINSSARAGLLPALKETGFTPRFEIDYKSFSKLSKLTDTPNPRLNASPFSSRLALYFPEIAVMIDEDDFGILHLEVGIMKNATRDAIAQADWYTVRKHFNFIADMLDRAEEHLADALRISYLGNLFYDEVSANYAKARSLLPQSLSKLLHEVERHYENLARLWQAHPLPPHR